MHQVAPHGDFGRPTTCTSESGQAHPRGIPRLQALGVVSAACCKVYSCTGTLSISLTKDVSIKATHIAPLRQPTLVVCEALELSHPATESHD